MKTIPKENYIIRPFKAFKTHIYSNEYLNSGSDGIHLDEATKPPDIWLWVTESVEAINADGIYKRPLYKSITQLFYPSASVLPWNSAEYHGTGSLRRPPQFYRGFYPSSSCYVLSISQNLFGEKIKESSLRLTSNNSTASIYDDGLGKLISSTDTSSVIGNIFYSLGIAVIQKMTSTGALTGSVVSHEGLYLSSGSHTNIQFDSQITIYEHSIYCTIDRGELNYSTNASLNLHQSSSISGSVKLFDVMASGSLVPYVTTIGLYSSDMELIAIAKVPKPVKRAVDIQQTFVVKFDM